MGYCSYCGEKLTGAHFCTKCGQKVEVEAEKTPPDRIFKDNPGEDLPPAPKKRKPVLAIIGIALTVIVLLRIVLHGDSMIGPDFQEIALECAGHADWAKIGTDNSYLRIDTNPDDDGMDVTAYNRLERINQALGLPDYLFEDFGRTSSTDGLRSFSHKNIQVTWEYSSARGLEVMYTSDRSRNRSKFREVYDTCCLPNWIEVGENNDYLRISYDEYASAADISAAIEGFVEVHDALQLSSSLKKDILTTVSSDGLGEYQTGDLYITWKRKSPLDEGSGFNNLQDEDFYFEVTYRLIGKG